MLWITTHILLHYLFNLAWLVYKLKIKTADMSGKLIT